MSQYVCSDCGRAESACACPEGHVRSWVKAALVAHAHHRYEAKRALESLAGHKLTAAEEQLKRDVASWEKP